MAGSEGARKGDGLKALSGEQLSEYRQRGFLFPVAALSDEEASGLRKKLEELEMERGGKLPATINRKPHLLVTWLNDLIRDSRILDPVEDILGPDILCWGSGFFVKNPGDRARVTWHQDSTYWGLSEPDIVTAWVALTPSTHDNGCMRVIPGTHRTEQLPHKDTFAADNLLSRGQEIEVEVDEGKAVDVALGRGEMSLHHVMLVHGSEPNSGNDRRIGFAIRYLPTYVKQLSGVPDSATLVRGKDTHGNFVLETTPRSDFDSEAAAFHARWLAANDQILYREMRPK